MPYVSYLGCDEYVWPLERTLSSEAHYGEVVSCADTAFDDGADPLNTSACFWMG
jgi:hypothetical protein